MSLLRLQRIDLLPEFLLLDVELLELTGLQLGLSIQEFDLPFGELSVASAGRSEMSRATCSLTGPPASLMYLPRGKSAPHRLWCLIS